MEKITALIVDDQSLFAEGLKYVLRGESGGQIDICGIAENGKQSIEMAQRLQPEVILMDIRMPVMDGVEATDIIHRQFPDIKIMILTTFDDDELVFHALSYGARGYVLKSIEPQDLVLSIKAVSKGALYISPSVGFKLIELIKAGEEEREREQMSATAAIVKKIPSLTFREAEVLSLVMGAKRNGDIAAKLYISEKTVKNHISNIYDKLGIHNRLRLMSYINGLGIGSGKRPES